MVKIKKPTPKCLISVCTCHASMLINCPNYDISTFSEKDLKKVRHMVSIVNDRNSRNQFSHVGNKV